MHIRCICVIVWMLVPINVNEKPFADVNNIGGLRPMLTLMDDVNGTQSLHEIYLRKPPTNLTVTYQKHRESCVICSCVAPMLAIPIS